MGRTLMGRGERRTSKGYLVFPKEGMKETQAEIKLSEACEGRGGKRGFWVEVTNSGKHKYGRKMFTAEV